MNKNPMESYDMFPKTSGNLKNGCFLCSSFCLDFSIKYVPKRHETSIVSVIEVPPLAAEPVLSAQQVHASAESPSPHPGTRSALLGQFTMVSFHVLQTGWVDFMSCRVIYYILSMKMCCSY